MKSKNAGLIIFICIIAASFGIAALAILSVNPGTLLKNSPQLPSKKIVSNEYIAHVHISGVIQSSNAVYNQKWLLDTIYKLKGDKKNVGLIMSINSPGGTVYESDEVYLAIREYAESGKPVWAYLEQLAASGGYYIACGGDYIVANRNTLTGSIGVIAGQSVDLTGLMERYGIKVTTITAGKNKNMLNIDSPLTEEQRGIMQSIADECYDQFVAIVAEARGMNKNAVRKRADGRIYTAQQAVDEGLVDEIGTLDETIDWFIDDLDMGDKKIDTIDFKYNARTTVWNFLGTKFNLLPELEILKRVPEVNFPAYLFMQ